MRRISLAFTFLLTLVTACSGNPQPIALVASSPASLEVGNQRVLLGLIDPETQAFLPDPAVPATANFVGPNDETIEVPLDFTWAIPDVRGLYRAEVDLPSAGPWSVSVAAEGFEPTESTPFVVSEETAMPQVGDPAPAVETRTSEGYELAEITSDTNPDPDLYRLSLDDALADDRPTVIAFATPAFCSSETCGPVLEHVKQVAADHPGVDFVHVEIYENLDAESFDDLVPVEAVETWALPSEPWVFVTDSEGVITARFEGAVDPQELGESLSQLGI
jgi:hypothetical protein